MVRWLVLNSDLQNGIFLEGAKCLAKASNVINSVPNHLLITQVVGKHGHQLVCEYCENNVMNLS